MNKEETVARVEKYIKSFNGNALDCVSIGTLLNLLEKKDKESHFIQSELDIANAKIIKLNNIIDLMAKEINLKEPLKYNNIQEVKQHFERKVENGN